MIQGGGDHVTVNWHQMMALGLGVLRLPPEQFWAMTPVEFLAALEGAGFLRNDRRALSRSSLADLMARFPDITEMKNANR